MVEVCHIPCPLDCKLSDWSAWSACTESCGSGLKIRSKWLREKAFNGGRPCPKLDLKNQVRLAPVVLHTLISCTVQAGHTLLQVTVFTLCWCFCHQPSDKVEMNSSSYSLGISISILRCRINRKTLLNSWSIYIVLKSHLHGLDCFQRHIQQAADEDNWYLNSTPALYHIHIIGG